VLGVWADFNGKNAKVFNIKWWPDRHALRVIYFRRGQWEDELLALALAAEGEGQTFH
jgi:hypothetical protein